MIWNSDNLNQLVESLKSELPSDCEIFRNPFLNGLRPDIAILHNLGGLSLIYFEFLNTLENFEIVSDQNGGRSILIETSAQTTTHKIPYWKLQLAKREANELYGFRLRSPISIANNPAQITFRICYPNLTFSEDNKREINNDIHSLDSRILDKTDILEHAKASLYVPQIKYETFPMLEPQNLADLRNWLHPPESSKLTPIKYTSEQSRVVENNNSIPRRRLKGGPGVGKTEALLGRVAQLASGKKETLYLTYNLTLINELRTRYATISNLGGSSTTWLNFHEWCKRLSLQFGFEREWASLFKDADNDQGPYETVGNFISQQLSNLSISDEFKFDAIIVDEAQDMHISWIKAALLFLRPAGELLIAADTRQDIYERSSDWTNETISGLGFTGPWLTLNSSHRTPYYLVPLINKFKSQFLDSSSFEDMPDLSSDVPRTGQLSLGDKLELHPCTEENLTENAYEVIHKLIEQDRKALSGAADRSVEDITVLVPTKQIGIEIAQKLGDHNIKIETTFEVSGLSGNLSERDLKLGFSTRSGEVKISTIHSFKGMSGSRVVLILINRRSQSYKSEVYVGLSRLKAGALGHSMFLVSSNNELNLFFQSNQIQL